jgi:thioredoxin reductase (NADPH)
MATNTAEDKAEAEAKAKVESDIDLYDITIIGGGPTGLFGLFYAGLRQAKTKLIDSMSELGGQLTALYPEKYIYDMPGYPKVLTKHLVKAMVEQAIQFNPAICLEENVLDLKKEDNINIFKLTTNKGVHYTKTAIIAGGVGAFSPRKLKAKGIDELEGKGVYYTVKNPDAFAGKDIVIVGAGDSALDWALMLEPVVNSITLVHRRDVFRAHEESIQKLFKSSAKIMLFYEVKEVHGQDKLEAVTIFENRSKEETTLKAEALIISIGFLASLGPIASWGLELENGSIKVNSKMETNIPGVYAAGDINTYPGKLKLIATGVGEAAIAVNFAKNYIDPTAKAFPGHSSDMKIFK